MIAFHIAYVVTALTGWITAYGWTVIHYDHKSRKDEPAPGPATGAQC